MTKYKKFVTALKKSTAAARVKELLEELMGVVEPGDNAVRKAVAEESGLLPALVSCLQGG